VRAMFSNLGFTISVFVTVAIAVGFAFVFGAEEEVVASMLVLGLVTAIVEYVMRSRQQVH
jgi:hypothetical protein